MSSQPCSVCQQPTFKYRCPSCRATSCSLQCFKTHKSACNDVNSDQGTQTPLVTESPPKTAAAERLPFTDMLVRDARLQELFKQHPSLRAKLKSIFLTVVVTNDQEEVSQTRTFGAQKRNRSLEQRIAQAMRMLEHNLNSESVNASGLKAFAALVAELGSHGQPENSTSHPVVD